MKFKQLQFSTILFGLEKMIKRTARKHPAFAERLKEKNLTAQIKIADDSAGRYFVFENGRVRSKAGIHPHPDICMTFVNAAVAVELLMPPRDQLAMIHAMKNFQIGMQGDEELFMWFNVTLNQILTVGLEYGVDLGNGLRRFTSNTNGGPVFVYVREGKIVRMTPIEFDERDAGPWTIEARGKKFTPPRKTTVNPYTLAWKSMVYSDKRLLYPMKRVDFDPAGARNPQNRGKSRRRL